MLNKPGIKVFADGPTLAEIKDTDRKVVKGYTFNPTLFRKLGVENYVEFCQKVLRVCDGLPVSFEVFADDEEGMIRQARILYDLGSNVFVKIPITYTSGQSTLAVMEDLVADQIRLNITAVFTKKQVKDIIPVIKDSRSIVSIFAGRLFDIGVDAVSAVREMSDLVHGSGNCEVLWASPRMVYDYKNAEIAKCDIITMAPALIKKLDMIGMAPEEYSLDTVKMFYQDAKASGYEL